MPKVEQDTSPHLASELPNGEVVFSQQMRLGRLLKLDPGQSKTRKLLDGTPFEFEVRNLGDSFLHIASFSQRQPVTLRQFLDLLSLAKPGGSNRPESQSILGIMGDWDILLPEVRSKDPIKKALYDYHKKYIPGFTEFEENHFKLFWKVLESGNKRSRKVEGMVPLIVWQTDKQTGERSYYCGRLDKLPKHDTLLGQLVVAAYSPQVRDQMPKKIKIVDEKGEKKEQLMLEAQTVLLVPRFARKFLAQSPVILGLEALATQRVPLGR